MAVDERLGGRFALETRVEVSKSKADIEALLEKYNADNITFNNSKERLQAVVMFSLGRYAIQIRLPLPDREADFFKCVEKKLNQHTEKATYIRPTEQAEALYQQHLRARWRQLLLVIRAKLEAIDIGISTIEREFLADVMLPQGGQVGDHVIPIVVEAIEKGEMPQGVYLLESKLKGEDSPKMGRSGPEA